MKHHGINSASDRKEIVEKLLPSSHLTITRGNVAGMDATMTYKMSAGRGISGVCILSGGIVYDTFPQFSC